MPETLAHEPAIGRELLSIGQLSGQGVPSRHCHDAPDGSATKSSANVRSMPIHLRLESECIIISLLYPSIGSNSSQRIVSVPLDIHSPSLKGRSFSPSSRSFDRGPSAALSLNLLSVKMGEDYHDLIFLLSDNVSTPSTTMEIQSTRRCPSTSEKTPFSMRPIATISAISRTVPGMP